MTMYFRPILLNSCARAATATEAAYRIDRPIAPSRGVRVLALDDRAGPIVRRVGEQPWTRARFLARVPGQEATAGNGDGPDLPLQSLDGSASRLTAELNGADVVMMVATDDDGAVAAGVIGEACALRGIMTAGIVVAQGNETGACVAALRPYARVLMITEDETDVAEVLTALRA